jgi:hypothetical protein
LYFKTVSGLYIQKADHSEPGSVHQYRPVHLYEEQDMDFNKTGRLTEFRI